MTISRSRNLSRMTALLLCCMFCMSFMLLSSTKIAFCTGGETTPSPGSVPSNVGNALEGVVDSLTNLIYRTMRRIVTPIAACFMSFAGFQYMFGGSKGIDKAKASMFAGVVGILLVVFAPLIAQGISQAVADQGAGNLSDMNPLRE